MPHTYRNAWAALILITTLLLLTTGRPTHAASELAIGDYQLVSSKRVTRTVFEYTYKATVTNNTGIDVTEVSATVSINAPGITVIDNYLEFGVVPNGAISESNDTFTIRQDRQQTFEPSELIWNFQYEAQAAQPRVSWDIPSLNIEILNGTVEIRPVSFKVDHSIANPGFLVETIDGDLPINLANLIVIQSSKTSALAENDEIQLGLVFNVSADISAGEYWGVLHVLDGEKAIADPLEITLLVTMGSSDVVPEGVSIPDPDRIVLDQDIGQLFTIDQIEVVLRDGTDFDAFSSRLSVLGGVFTGRVPFLPFYQIRFPNVNTPADLDYFIETLQSDEDVLVASREWRSESRAVPPNDKEYNDSAWDEHNPSGKNAPWEFVNFVSAWNDIYAGVDVSQLKKINIAVVDYGFTYHTDLKNNILYSDILLQTTLIPSVFTGNYSHGTSVAGIIGAVANNDLGVAGGVWNTKLRLYDAGSITGIARNILSGGSTFTTMAVIQKAVKDGTQILNYSQGELFKNLEQFNKNNLKWRKFFDTGNQCDPQSYCTKNILFVFAAPNPPETGDFNDSFLIDVQYDLPASLAPDYENIISVTDMNSANFVPINSTAAHYYGLGAGGQVTVAAPGEHWVIETIFDNLAPVHSYNKRGGTSYATPMVSALAGLILTKDPNVTPKQIKDIIVKGACAGKKKVENRLNDANGQSGHLPINIIDAYESLKIVDNPDGTVCKDGPIPTATGKLNDTGITTCSNNSQNGLQCPVSGFPGQDGEHGRDALAAAGLLQKVGGGSAGFDFTKLDANGNPLPADASEWSCVKDNHTGLIWEEKAASGLRSMNHTYTWYNPDSSTNGGNSGTQNGGNCIGSSCDTHGYVQAVNAQGLCGANDWRMPAREELRGIVDYSRINPAIDTGYFPRTLSTWYWSASPYADRVTFVWDVHFGNGDASININPKSHGSYVRLVRDGK